MKSFRTANAVRPTIIVESVKLDRELGVKVLIATESFQHTGSFKFRAAYNVATNSDASHLVTVSSGNFGQALAYACQLTGKRCTVVMPSAASKAKIEAVQKFGSTVRLVDVTVKSRTQWMDEIVPELGEVEVVSPFDDPRVIEGNASLADDLVAIADRFDTVVVPIGGGGLSSGLITGLKRHGITADIIGAEPLLGNDAARSLREGRIVANNVEPMSVADGARTQSLGQHNWAVLEKGLAGIVEVDEADIIKAVRLLFLNANLKAEPTGALSTGAVLTEHERFADRKPLLIVSGGNVDPVQYAKMFLD